jgi:transcriptional regulator with XRE-family HTH domain
MRFWLRDLRAKNGITSTELASALGVTQPEVTMLERGRRRATGITVAQIVKIAALMKETPEAILRKEMEYLGANH